MANKTQLISEKPVSAKGKRVNTSLTNGLDVSRRFLKFLATNILPLKKWNIMQLHL